MDPQKYIELETNIDVAHFEEWIGREYARSVSAPAYPIPPDGPGPHAPADYTWFYDRAVALAPNGGVFKLDDAIIDFATQEQTLSDDVEYSLDIETEAKTVDQLSAAAQAAVAPPPPAPNDWCSLCNHMYQQHSGATCSGTPMTPPDITLGHCSCPGFVLQ